MDSELPTFKQRLALRLEGFPLLRTLVLDRAFFWAFLGIVGLGMGMALSIPKVWQTTPEEFSRGRVRVSLIDFAQAWALSRTAAKAEAAGDYGKALLARRGALANNLGSAELHRRLLRHLKEVPEADPDQVLTALFSSSWLGALGRTNAADLELTCEVLEKYRVPGFALEMLGASAYANDPGFASIRARCLLGVGRTEDFLSLWRTHEAAWSRDPLMRLYHDAWQAGWETGTPAIEAMLRLKSGLAAKGNEGLTAARLLLGSAVRRGGPDDVALALKRLEEGNAASVAQYATYWRFLASLGRMDEAREGARAYARQPRLPMDAAEHAVVLASLGLAKEALEILEANLARFETHPVVWETYLSLLIDSRRWNDARRAAARAHVLTASFETVRILALFAEYRAEVGENRQRSADAVAARLAEARILDNGTALRVARVLQRDGRAGAALKVLKAKKGEMNDLREYWQAVFVAALEVRDFEAMQESTLDLLRLAPNNPVALSNRAAMLIAMEEAPGEALEITFRLITEYPNSAPFQINHAFALLLNQRVGEALTILEGLDPTRLERQAASAYHLAMAQALYAKGRFAEALDESSRVQTGMILPPQVERLEAMRRDLRAKLL